LPVPSPPSNVMNLPLTATARRDVRENGLERNLRPRLVQ
jgi:hypothetical protein